MSKVTTVWHQSHPHNRLNTLMEQTRVSYRSLPNKVLDAAVSGAWARIPEADLPLYKYPQHRHQKVGFLIARHEKEYKEKWALEMGWSFDEVYDKDRWPLRMRSEQEKAMFVQMYPQWRAMEEKIKTADKLESEETKKLLTIASTMREHERLSRYRMVDGKAVWKEGVTIETFVADWLPMQTHVKPKSIAAAALLATAGAL